MELLDAIERGFLFRVARGLTLMFTVVGLIATIIGGGIFLWTLFLPSTAVSPNEVADAMAVQPQTDQPTINSTKRVETDPKIRSAFDEVMARFNPEEYDQAQLRPIISQWIRDYPRQDQVSEFLVELSDALRTFPQDQRGTVLFTYARLKFDKVNAAEIQRNAVSSVRTLGLWAALVGLAATSLFSLGLVLLQIERNTRPS